MINGVIFDVDGVLLDSMPMWDHVSEYYLLAKGIQPEEELCDKMFTMSMEEGAAYLKNTYHLTETVAQVMDGITDTITAFYLEKAMPKEGIMESLEWLYARHIPMVIATSSDKEAVAKAFHRLGMAHYFETIITCAQVRASKKKPDIYLAAMRQLGTKPADTLVVEDTLHSIETAAEAGFTLLGVFDTSSAKQQGEIQKKCKYYAKVLTPEVMKGIIQ